MEHVSRIVLPKGRNPAIARNSFNLLQSGFTHPQKLVFDGRKSILRVILGPTDQIEKLTMKLRCRRGDNFEIRKQSIVGELIRDFSEQGTLPCVVNVMDREPSYHDIKGSKGRKCVPQIPL